MKIFEDNEPIVVTKYKRTTKAIRCDICGKQIAAISYADKENKSNEYYDVTTGNYDWGYDPANSVRDYDICPRCIDSFVSGYIANSSANAYVRVYRHWATLETDFVEKMQDSDSNEEVEI